MRYLISIFLTLALTPLVAQQKWQKILGGPKTDESNAVLLCADGSFMVGGSAESFSTQGDRDGYLAKLTPDGDLVWEKTYNTGSFWNPIHDMVETPGHHLVTTGKSWASICANSQGYGFECDSLGNLIWLKGFCSADNNVKISEAYTVAQAPDGGYVFCGDALVNISHGIVVFKTDATGNIQWVKGMGSSGWEIGNSAIVTRDGNILVAAYMSVVINGQTDAFLAKLSMQTGDTLWTRQIGASGSESFNDVVEEDDSSIVVLGYRGSGLWMLRFDANGALISEKDILPAPFSILSPSKFIQTADKGFAVIAGVYNAISPGSVRDALLLKLTPAFDVSWMHLYGKDKDDIVSDIVQTPDGGYCMAGQTKSFGDALGDIWVLKTDSLGDIVEHRIEGTVVIDGNQNCLPDGGETPFPNAWIGINGSSGSIARLTDETGVFGSLVNNGTYSLEGQVDPPYWSFCQNPQTAVVSDATAAAQVNFVLQKTIDCPHISIDAAMPFLRRCEERAVYVRICNTGSAPAPDTKVRIEFQDSAVTIDSASAPYAALGNNVYLFETGKLDLFECKSFRVYVHVDCDEPLGTQHCIDVFASPDTLCHPDALAHTQLLDECSLNIGSYDPNDKSARPAGLGPNHLVAAGTELRYRIRFQNTGTDTAFKVVILDTLSSLLDPFSLRGGASSHSYRMKWESGNALKFVFDPIALPDSNVNEAASHGFVDFFIKIREDLPAGLRVSNTAAIYFDANAPVFTNECFHTIGRLATGVSESDAGLDFHLYPNPAAASALVATDAVEPLELRIYDARGALVLRQTVLNGARVDTAQWPAGLYWYQVSGARTRKAGKLVKE